MGNLVSELRELISKEQWEILQKKYPHLEKLSYRVVCETCHLTFFETKVSAVQEMLRSGEWDPHLPQMWYVTAGRHWIAAKFHSVRVLVDDGHGDSTLIKDLSKEWLAGSKSFGFTDQAMLNELKDLENTILARNGKRKT